MTDEKEEKLTILTRVKWTDLAKDIKSGMTDEDIMKKHGRMPLSEFQLLKSQLVAMGLLSPKDFRNEEVAE